MDQKCSCKILGSRSILLLELLSYQQMRWCSAFHRTYVACPNSRDMRAAAIHCSSRQQHQKGMHSFICISSILLITVCLPLLFLLLRLFCPLLLHAARSWTLLLSALENSAFYYIQRLCRCLLNIPKWKTKKRK